MTNIKGATSGTGSFHPSKAPDMTHIFFVVHVDDALFCFNCSNLKHDVLFYSILKSPNVFLPRATWMVSLVEQDRLSFWTTWEHPILCWGSCCWGFSFVCSVLLTCLSYRHLSFLGQLPATQCENWRGENNRKVTLLQCHYGACPLSNMRKYREPETLKLYCIWKDFWCIFFMDMFPISMYYTQSVCFS